MRLKMLCLVYQDIESVDWVIKEENKNESLGKYHNDLTLRYNQGPLHYRCTQKKS